MKEPLGKKIWVIAERFIPGYGYSGGCSAYTARFKAIRKFVAEYFPVSKTFYFTSLNNKLKK